MKGLIQRVSCARVRVANEVIGRIGFGMLLFVGFEKADSTSKLELFLEKKSYDTEFLATPRV